MMVLIQLSNADINQTTYFSQSLTSSRVANCRLSTENHVALKMTLPLYITMFNIYSEGVYIIHRLTIIMPQVSNTNGTLDGVTRQWASLSRLTEQLSQDASLFWQLQSKQWRHRRQLRLSLDQSPCLGLWRTRLEFWSVSASWHVPPASVKAHEM